jgi:hypothetical protein
MARVPAFFRDSAGFARESIVSWLNHVAPSMQVHDFRLTRESAKHDDNTSIFPDVRNVFDTASRQILISHLAWAKDSKRIATLRGGR